MSFAIKNLIPKKSRIKETLTNPYTYSVLGIFLLAIFFRFFNYTNRWGLASDQARDAIIAIEALKLHALPLIGPFSASGPFVFGPYQYWFLMIVHIILYPLGFFGLWIGLTIFSTLIVIGMILIGKEIEDIRFGFLLALFTAISPAQVGLATNLVSSSLAGFLSIIAVYFFVRCLKRSSMWDFFFLGIFSGLAMNTHLQAIPLVLLFPTAFLLGKRTAKNALFLFLGILLPFIPLIIFDIQTHFYESSHLINFFLFSDSTTGVPRRWLTYLGITWPRLWGIIIGGNSIAGAAAMGASYFLLCFLAIKRKANKAVLALATVYFVIFVVFRYFSGKLFGNFTAFLDPFILIVVAWMCYKIMLYKKYLGLIVICVIFVSTIFTAFPMIKGASNNTAKNTKSLLEFFHKNFPPQAKFRLYDYDYKTTLISLPLVLYLDQQNKIDENGMKLGIANTTAAKGQVVYEDSYLYHEYVFNLQGFTNKQIGEYQWIPVTPLSVYNSVENWYKKSN